MMKAIAGSRGWEHGRHRHLHQVASCLRAEVGYRDIYCLFNTASTLHENFYENQMTALNQRQGGTYIGGAEKIGLCAAD